MFKWLANTAVEAFNEIKSPGYWKDATVVLKYTGMILSEDQYKSYRKEARLADEYSDSNIAEICKDEQFAYIKHTRIAYDILNRLHDFNVITKDNFESSLSNIGFIEKKMMKNVFVNASDIMDDPKAEISYFDRLRYNVTGVKPKPSA